MAGPVGRRCNDRPAKCREDFLRHVVTGAPLKSDLAAGIRDLAFAEACLRSGASRAWVEMEAPVTPA